MLSLIILNSKNYTVVISELTEYKLLIQSYIIKSLNPYSSVGIQGNICFVPNSSCISCFLLRALQSKKYNCHAFSFDHRTLKPICWYFSKKISLFNCKNSHQLTVKTHNVTLPRSIFSKHSDSIICYNFSYFAHSFYL